MNTAISIVCPPKGLDQAKVFNILVKHGYKASHLVFKQKSKPTGWLYVRLINWDEISEAVMPEIREFYHNSYIDWSDDKEFGQFTLILKH